MYGYRLAGLTLASAQPLKALERWHGSSPRSWTLVATKPSHRRRPRALRLAAVAGRTWRLMSPDGSVFWMSPAAREVRYALPPHVSRAAWLDLLAGPVASCLLALDGCHPLHGSAVRVDREAVCFLGQPGAGKSTLAAAGLLAGHSVIADDLLTVAWRQGRAYVGPGHPEIRLWPGSGRRLLPQFDQLPRVVPTASKRRLDPRAFPGGFARQPAPLRVMYTLQRSARVTRPRVRALSSSAAFLALLEHLYNTALQAPALLTTQFQQLGHLARHVSIRQLLLPRRRHDPSRTLRVVLDDAFRPPC